MTKTAKYILNPETLRVEKKKNKHRLLKTLCVVAAGAVLFALYLWIHASVLGKDLPKTAVLRRQNADWQSRVEQMGARLDRDEEVLSLLEVRDDRIYRSVYGMDEIPAAVRYAGIGGNNRYPELLALDYNNVLRQTAFRLDELAKRAYVQSKSLEDVAALAREAGNAFVVITHYQRLLDYIVPDFVHVMYDGRIVKSGGKHLAIELEEKGYEWIKEMNL